MKKITNQILAALLIIVSLLQMSMITYAEEQENTDYDIMLLTKLGFINEAFAPKSGDDLVSRSQFASMMAYLRGFDESYVTNNKKFVDIPADYWCAGQIYALYEVGLIHGTTEDMFSPNDYVTYPQLIKCLVSLLGYDVVAGQSGGYPNGYLSVASRIGLGSSTTKDTVNFRTVAKLIVKAMDTELLEQTFSLGSEAGYAKTSHQTPLKKYNDIYHDTGIMTDNGISTLTGNTRVGNSSVTINSTVMKNGGCDVDRYLGYKLDYYYRNDNGELTLLFVIPHNTNVVELTAKEIDLEHSGFSAERIYYTSNKGNGFYKIDGEYDVIYNGKAYSPELVADIVNTFKITQGKLTLIDNDGDGDYDVVNVEEYYSVYVSSIDIDNDRIYGKYGNFVDYGKFDIVKFYTNDGMATTVNAVSQKQVLSVFESRDNSLIKVIISTDSITGKVDLIMDMVAKTTGMTPAQIESFKNDARDMKIVVGEEEFTLSSELINAVALGYQGANIPTAGLTYVFHLDNNGKIAGIEDPTGKQYAYLISVKYITHGEMSELTKAKVFMEDSSIITTVFAKKVRVNGKQYKGQDNGVDGVCNCPDFLDSSGNFKRQPIKIRLNNLGEIKEVETAKPLDDTTTKGKGYNPKNEFTRCDEKNKTDDSVTVGWGGSKQRRFDPYTLANDAIIFNVPPDSEFDEDELSVISANSLVEETKYQVKLYDADASWACKFAVIQAGESGEWLEAPCIIESIKTAIIDEDDTVAKIATGLESTKQVTYVENKPGLFEEKGLAVGDIVRVKKGIGDKILDLEILVSTKDKKAVDKEVSKDWHTYYGQLYARSDTGFTLTMDGGATLKGIPFHSDYPVNVYDTNTRTARRGTRNDMVMKHPISDNGSISLPSVSSLTGDDMIYVYLCKGYARCIIVVKY